jgi:hypothetical protein
MKTLLNLSLALVAAGMLGTVAAPAAAGRNLQMVVVAEQTDARTPRTLPTPELPAFYVAFDGGYIEAGDPIANEQPPAASAIAQALESTLASQGFEPATGTQTPSVVIIYHWGLLNRDSRAARNGNKIDPNLHARLSLVSTNRQDGEIEKYLVDRRLLATSSALAHAPEIPNFHERDILQLAHDNRYFVVVSAYDYAAVIRQEGGLLWRAKMSTYSGRVSMADALPTLIRGGAPYLGRNLRDFEYVAASMVSGSLGQPGARQFAPPMGNLGLLDAQFLRSLMKQEHDEFSGARSSDTTAYDPIVSVSPAGAASPTPVIQPKPTGTY